VSAGKSQGPISITAALHSAIKRYADYRSPRNATQRNAQPWWK